MKRYMVLLLLLAVFLAGCGRQEAVDPHPDWDASWFRVSEDLGVEPPTGFALNESNDVMSMAGLYYATWTAGAGRETTNSQGRDALVYDAQLYVLVKLHDSAADAEADVADWMDLEGQNYETGPEDSLTAAGQEFRVLPLLQGKESNPYQFGLAAFAIRGADTITVELLCTEAWDGDPEASLADFLGGFHYGK